MDLKRKYYCHKVCQVTQCNKKNKMIKRSFHEFPSNLARREKWVEVLGISKPLTSTSMVCGLHFRDDDYSISMSSDRKQLLPTAVPRLNSSQYVADNSIVITKEETPPQLDTQSAIFSEHNPIIKFEEPTFEELKCSSLIKEDVDINLRPTGNGTFLLEFQRPRTPKVDKELCSNRRKGSTAVSVGVQVTLVNEHENFLLKKKNRSMQRKLRRLQIDREKYKAKIKDLKNTVQEHEKSREYTQLQKIKDALKKGNHTATYLIDQLINFGKKRCQWSETSIRHCSMWRLSSTKGYDDVRRSKIVKAPSRGTIEKYMGNKPKI